MNYKVTNLAAFVLLSLITSMLTSCWPTPPIPRTSCINLPANTSRVERDNAIKLEAGLIEGVGSAGLDLKYKKVVDTAFSQVSPQMLDQLVAIEFLHCIKTRYKDQTSPREIAAMERALEKAILRLAGALSRTGGITPGARQYLGSTTYGAEKIQALSSIGL